jgi:hypothetical protein
LFTDGCVIVTRSGFQVYAACSKSDVPEYNERYTGEGSGESFLPERTRFTLAHELGHTLLFDAVCGVPSPWISNTDDPKVLAALEKTCDGVAGRLLLPNTLVRKEIRQADLYDPRELRNLAVRAKVSTSVLVKRMGELEALLGSPGAFLYVSGSADRHTMLLCRAHPSVRALFPQELIGKSFSDFFLHCSDHFLLKGGSQLNDVIEFPNQPEWLRRFEIRCEEPHQAAITSGLYVTIRAVSR